MRAFILFAAFTMWLFPAVGHASRAKAVRRPAPSLRGVVRPAGDDSTRGLPSAAGDPLAEGARVIDRAVQAAGGAEAYDAARGAGFRMVTTDYKAGAILRADTTRVRFRTHGANLYVEKAPNGTVVGCDGVRGWGWRNGAVSLTPQDSAIGRFQARWIPFWFELPFRFRGAGMNLRYSGSIGLDRGMPTEMRVKIHSQPDKKPKPTAATVLYDVVFITESDSTRPGDEFFAFFEHRTGRFRGCNFTIKEAGMKSFKWCSWLDDFVKVGGLEVARTQTFYRLATDNLPDFNADQSGVVRVYRKLEPLLDNAIPEEQFRPPAR